MIALAQWIAALALAGQAASPNPAPASGAAPRSEIVSVAGCLREQPAGTWTLVNASDPTPSPDGPVTIAPGSAPRLGANRFRLLGVAAFRLPARRDHTVVVQGMVVGSGSTKSLNVTSVQNVVATCAAPPILE